MILTKEQENILQQAIDNAIEKGSKYPGMSYEEGMEAVLQVLRGDATAEEIT